MLVYGSYPDQQAELEDVPQQQPGQEHWQEVDDESAGPDCVIPCGHIYDPVCAISSDDNIDGGGGTAVVEVREFPNECTMTRFNCEQKKREYDK